MALYFSGLVRNASHISALGCLETIACKKKHVPRKKVTRKNNFQLVRWIFNKQNLLIKTVTF